MASSIVLTLSCSSSSDDNSSNNNSLKITPPAWIIGNWKYEEPQYPYSYRLSSNNICMVIQGSENCMKEYIELYQNTNAMTNVEQRISDAEYYCKITVQGSSNIYHFQKVSENTIKDVIMSNSSGTTVLLKKEQIMKKHQNQPMTNPAILGIILFIIAILKTCDNKSEYYNGWHRSDPEMNIK